MRRGRDLTQEDPAVLRESLRQARSVAVVGASPNPLRPSHGVAAYLQANGYRIIPVNPTIDSATLLGERVTSSLADVSLPIDIVDVFRRSEFAGAAIDQAIAEASRLGIKLVWLQLGIHDAAAAERARTAGLDTVEDRCLKIDHARLGVAAR